MSARPGPARHTEWAIDKSAEGDQPAPLRCGVTMLRTIRPLLFVGALLVGLLPAGPALPMGPSQVAEASIDDVDLDVPSVVPEVFLDRPWLVDPRLAPELTGVEADSDEVAVAIAAFDGAAARRDAAEADRVVATDRLTELVDARARLETERIVVQRQLGKYETHLTRTSDAIRLLAVTEYVDGRRGTPNHPSFSLDLESVDDARRHVVGVVFEEQLAEAAIAGWAHGVTAERAGAVEHEMSVVTAETDRTEEDLADAVARRDLAGVQADQAALDARLARRTAAVVGLDMTVVVLDAYVRAASALAEEAPSCGLDWSLLAGVGRTESWHGTYGGSSVEADGSLTEPIIGIALDGNGVARITDTDGGLLDGDPVFDRAVGPMQFIPGTWRRWERDGTGNGVADPQNYYDAAQTAAAYLCYYGPGLDGPEGQRRALLGYNQSSAYVALVRERAAEYAEFSLADPAELSPADPAGPAAGAPINE